LPSASLQQPPTPTPHTHTHTFPPLKPTTLDSSVNWELPQISKSHKGDIRHVLYWAPSNISCHPTKFVLPGGSDARYLCVPAVKHSAYMYYIYSSSSFPVCAKVVRWTPNMSYNLVWKINTRHLISFLF